MKHPIPTNEKARLKAVRDVHILDTPEEEEYNSLVQLIAAITDCPISLISIVDEDRQWFKARKGLTDQGTSREMAFCSHTIMQDEVMIIEDALKDERFSQNPFVRGAYKVRFYAGVPVKSPEGHAMGSVCVLDTKPRQLSEAKQKALQVVANKVGELLWLRKRDRQSEKLSVGQSEESSIDELKEQHQRILDLIGYKLHEDYAQSIAACMKFMEIAQSSDELASPTIARTREVLSDVLERMRQLSQQINPTHFKQTG